MPTKGLSMKKPFGAVAVLDLLTFYGTLLQGGALRGPSVTLQVCR